jgi:alkaline phosphatase D
VADLHAQAEDPRSPIVATEFCGTSISSHGASQSRLDAMRSFNPELRYARSDRRGYVHLRLDRQGALATLRGIEQPDDPASPATTMARYHVDPAQYGAQPA